MKFFQKMHLSPYFSFKTVSGFFCRQKKHPHIAILPTALFNCGADADNSPHKTRQGIYFIPYSDHSSYEELFTFISHLKPAEIYPIVNETKLHERKPVSHREDMKVCSIIPQSLHDLCCKRKKITDCQDKQLVLSCSTEKPKELTSHMSSKVRCTRSIGRPRIIQNKKLSKASEKKGVQFDSSCSSSSYSSSDDDDEDEDEEEEDDDDDDDTSETGVEREEVLMMTSDGKYTRVKIPHNIKNNLIDVEVKLSDVRSLSKAVTDVSTPLNTNRKPFLRDLSVMFSGDGLSEGRVCADDYEVSPGSGGRIKLYKGMNPSEELGCCPATYHNHLDNLPQEMSLSYAMYIKDTVVKQENPDDVDHMSISSVPTVTAPEIKFVDEEDGEVKGLIDFSVKEEDIYKHDIYSDDENNLLSCSTADTTQDTILWFHSDSDNENMLRGRSESNTAPNKTKHRFSSDCRGSLHRRRWNESAQSLEQRMPHAHSTQEAITEQSPSLRKRNHAHTELMYSLCTDSSDLELNRTNKRKKCCSRESNILTHIHSFPNQQCSIYTNGMVASHAHGREDEETLNKGCKRNLDEACHDRLGISVQSSQVSDYLSEPNMQLSDNESLSQVSCAPASLNCSNDNENRVSSCHTCCKKRKANTIHPVSKARHSNVQNRRSSHTADCSRDITFPKETRISTFHSSKEPHQAVVTAELTDMIGEDALPCDITCNRMEAVRDIQSSELSFYTCTASELQSEMASTTSERISNLEGVNESVSGGRMGVVCLSDNNEVISSPEQSKSDLPLLSTDERAEKFHGKFTEKNSRMSHFIHSPVSSNSHNTSQIDLQKHDVGIQCELLRDHGLSGFCHSQVCYAPIDICVINESGIIPSENSVAFVNLSQEAEVFTTVSGAMNSRQSDKSEVADTAKKKQSSQDLTSELDKPSNAPNLGSPKRSTVTMDDTHVDESYGLGKRSDPKNSAPKNKDPFIRDPILQDNNYYRTDTTAQGVGQSPAYVIAHKSSNDASRSNQDVRNTVHSIRGSNRTVTTDNEESQYPERLRRKPAGNGMDLNYWTNGNRTPFAMVEVYLAAKRLTLHKIGPLHHFNVSGSSTNIDEEDRYQQQIHTTTVFNLKHSAQQGKQFTAPLSTDLPDSTHKCNKSRHMALTEHRLKEKQKELNCSNDTEDMHTISSKARTVNASCVIAGLSGRLVSQDTFSNSDRGENAQIEDKTVNSGSATPLCLYTAEKSPPCDKTIIDNKNVRKTSDGTVDIPTENGGKVAALEISEGSENWLGENRIRVILETSEESIDLLCGFETESEPLEMSDDSLSSNKVVPKTSQQSDEHLHEARIVSESSQQSDDQVHEARIVPRTPQQSDVQLYETRIVPETPQQSDVQLYETRIVPKTSQQSDEHLHEARIVSESSQQSDDQVHEARIVPETPQQSDVQLYETRIVSESSQQSNDQVHEARIVPETSQQSDDQLHEARIVSESSQQSDDQVHETGVVPETLQQSDDQLHEARIMPETPQQSDDQLHETGVVPETPGSPTTTPIKEIHSGPQATWHLHRRGSPAHQSHNIRNFRNTTPIFNKFCSTSAVLDGGSNVRQNLNGVLSCLEENELNNSSILKTVGKLQTVLSKGSFSINSVSRGKRAKRKCLCIQSEMSSDDDDDDDDDDQFPSDQVTHVTKTYGRTSCPQDASKNSELTKSLHFTKHKPSETDPRQ
jgi:hypothetical protein